MEEKIERNKRIYEFRLTHPTMSYAKIGRIFRHKVDGKSIALNASVIFRIIKRMENLNVKK